MPFFGTVRSLFGNGVFGGWQGKRNRPCWKTSTEWQRRDTVANHAAGLPTPSGCGPAPSLPTGSLGITQCGSSEKRENHRIHWGPQDRNGSLGANVVGERHALPRSCTTFSGGRAFTEPNAGKDARRKKSGLLDVSVVTVNLNQIKHTLTLTGTGNWSGRLGDSRGGTRQG